MLAYTGLETVANLAAETREPGRTCPAACSPGSGWSPLICVGIVVLSRLAPPGARRHAALGTDWLRAPLIGIVDALRGPLPDALASVLRVDVGLTGTLILLARSRPASRVSGAWPIRSASTACFRGTFGRLNRRTLIPPSRSSRAALISTALLFGTSLRRADVTFLASLYSFGARAPSPRRSSR